MRAGLNAADHRRFCDAVHAALDDKAPPDSINRLVRVLWTLARVWADETDESYAAAAARFTRARRHIDSALEVLESEAAPTAARYSLLSAAAQRLSRGHRWPNQAAGLCHDLRNARALLAAAAATAAGHRGPQRTRAYMQLAALAYCRAVPRGRARASATRGGAFHLTMIAVKQAATGRGLRWTGFLALPRTAPRK